MLTVDGNTRDLRLATASATSYSAEVRFAHPTTPEPNTYSAYCEAP